MENNTEEVFTLDQIIKKEKENGKKERELDGLKMIIKKLQHNENKKI